jgi:hypothetical protein
LKLKRTTLVEKLKRHGRRPGDGRESVRSAAGP